MPIDITLRGSFIDFGQLLESMKTGRYRLTVSNIDIAQKRSSPSQTIKFISYGYFQSMSSGNRLAQNKTPIIKKNKPIVGICLGAQLIAKIYGSKISKSKNKLFECGYKKNLFLSLFIRFFKHTQILINN